MFVTCHRKCQQVRKHPENIQNYRTESYCNYLKYKIKKKMKSLNVALYTQKMLGSFTPMLSQIWTSCWVKFLGYIKVLTQKLG